jgi:hypothetical protein
VVIIAEEKGVRLVYEMRRDVKCTNKFDVEFDVRSNTLAI